MLVMAEVEVGCVSYRSLVSVAIGMIVLNMFPMYIISTECNNSLSPPPLNLSRRVRGIFRKSSIKSPLTVSQTMPSKQQTWQQD